MRRQDRPRAERREPIRVRWIWVVFAILFALINPWYFPAGAQALLWGVPVWALIILAASLALSGFIHYVLARHWHIEEDEHDG